MMRAVSVFLLSLTLSAQTNSGTFRTSKLIAVIGNNAASGDHRAGYNGIFRLTAPGSDESVFVPSVAGVNLEHYFDGRPTNMKETAVFFEPRYAPMQFRTISPTRAELIQPPTPVYGVESRTAFELKEPYYIDVSYRAIPRKGPFTGNYLGIFWASYINAPADKSIYFLNAKSALAKPQWLQLCSQVHGRDSTVLPGGDAQELSLEKDSSALFRNYSPLRFGEPFFYGRRGDMVLIYVFKPNPYLRFAHSPSGGGRSPAGDDTNPAWDFQMVIPQPETGKEYGLDMRVIYKPWSGRDDVLREVRAWLAPQ